MRFISTLSEEFVLVKVLNLIYHISIKWMKIANKKHLYTIIQNSSEHNKLLPLISHCSQLEGHRILILIYENYRYQSIQWVLNRYYFFRKANHNHNEVDLVGKYTLNCVYRDKYAFESSKCHQYSTLTLHHFAKYTQRTS